MKKRLLLLLLLLGPLGAAAQVRFETKSTDAVREMALRSGKLVLIDLYATWCPPCRLMEREVFSLREVGEFVEARFVAAKYDVDKHTGRELMRRYGSGSIPLYLVFDTDRPHRRQRPEAGITAGKYNLPTQRASVTAGGTSLQRHAATTD